MFVEILGWDRHRHALDIEVDARTYELSAVAEKRGVVVYECRFGDEEYAESSVRRKIEGAVARHVREHLIVYAEPATGAQVWQWVKREIGKPAVVRGTRPAPRHERRPSGRRSRGLEFALEEEESLTVSSMSLADCKPSLTSTDQRAHSSIVSS